MVSCFAVEVGARGYCSDTVRSCLRKLGILKKKVKESDADVKVDSVILE